MRKINPYHRDTRNWKKNAGKQYNNAWCDGDHIGTKKKVPKSNS